MLRVRQDASASGIQRFTIGRIGAHWGQIGDKRGHLHVISVTGQRTGIFTNLLSAMNLPRRPPAHPLSKATFKS
jgi:hypothetical protein